MAVKSDDAAGGVLRKVQLLLLQVEEELGESKCNVSARTFSGYDDRAGGNWFMEGV